MNIPFLDKEFIDQHTDFAELISVIQTGFKSEQLETPMRHHHNYTNQNTLLLMPAWEASEDMGIKIVSVNPDNSKKNLPSIHGLYMYLDFETGRPLAILDASTLTTYRTAATSALAASYLARKDSSSLLMIGTGALAPKLIAAHRAIRPLSKVFIWGRNDEKAKQLVDQLSKRANEECQYESAQNIQEKIGEVSLISAATYAQNPLIEGKWLAPGQHVDLVGSYKPDMREADDEVMRRSSIFVDSYAGALTESGDLVIPLETEVIKREEVKADLFELCREQKRGRQFSEEITLFKSVGHGLEDLVAARYYVEKYLTHQ